MAARLNRKHTEQVLERIRYSALIARLQENALGQLKNPNTGAPIEMSEGQIRSAIFLLERKLAKAVAPKRSRLSQMGLACVKTPATVFCL
jgi:hypothetical protein